VQFECHERTVARPRPGADITRAHPIINSRGHASDRFLRACVEQRPFLRSDREQTSLRGTSFELVWPHLQGFLSSSLVRHLPNRAPDMDSKPYLDCLGCGLVLRGYRGPSTKTLCVDCSKFAALAHSTRCPQCRSSAVLCCTEPNGFETFFCTVCDRVWCHAPASVGSGHVQSMFPKQTRWAGVERRLLLSSADDASVSEFRKTG
jgi:hypothetical protein